MPGDQADGSGRVERERDFYLRLLQLGAAEEIEPLLREALALIVETTRALQAYVEISDPAGDGEQAYWLAHDCTSDELDSIRARISRGVIAASLAAGTTIETTSALLDARFRERDSVQLGHIEAVLCAPIGLPTPIGVVYLHGHRRQQAFPKEVRDQVELFASQVAPLADRLLARHREARELDRTRAVRATLRADNVVGRSDALASALRQVALFAPLDVPVLFFGAPGTGRRLLARVLHENGARAGKPLLEAGCSDLSSEVFFGSREGGGLLAQAAGGSLLLRDVERLPADTQARLVRWLDAAQSPQRQPDVRLLATADLDLERAPHAGVLRADLLRELQTLSVRVPALADRPGDVPLLARWFCEKSSERRRAARLDLSVSALRAVETHDWPGHVAELEARIEAAVGRALDEGLRAVESRHVFPPAAPGAASGAPPTFQQATREFQRQLVARVLEETRWNVSEAARRLDLTRSHLYNLIHAFALARNGP
jgi:Nif-specific regulatory protein